METKLKFLAQSALAFSAFVIGPMAHGAQAVPDSLGRCAAIVDAARRLACFDAELQRLGVPATGTPGASSTAAAGPVGGPNGPIAPATAPALTPEQKFGATGELRQKQDQEPVLKELTANIKDVRKAPSGHYVVTLDNGQVWRQVTPGAVMIRAGQPVTIKPRALGSFWIIDSSGRGNRFKRIQ